VDAQRAVSVIPYTRMFGRLTGNARHLTDPVGKIYCATMEEGLYEVDVKTLEVTELWADEQKPEGRHAGLPGYHGKGLYSGYGRIIYANNGDHAKEALSNPAAPSGSLAEWDGRADQWTVVRRNQFTEVTGPGGIYGNPKPDRDPVWSVGWDHRSLILEVLDGGKWHSFRLPKGSHSYDGAHGWNTEWPRIRDIGEDALLMTMHGMFWRFPRTFSSSRTGGIRPRSAYLKVIGDFCGWNGRLVFGCDDTARSEFLNKRKVKGDIAGPGQSQSNLWFTDPVTPGRLGPTLASGAVWLRDAVRAGDHSEPFLFAGWKRRSAHLVNGGMRPLSFAMERDLQGNGQWTLFHTVTVAPGEAVWWEADEAAPGEWIRVKAGADCTAATVQFTYSGSELRRKQAASIFAGLATIDDGTPQLAGLIRAQGANKRTLHLAAMRVRGTQLDDIGYYELGASLELRAVEDPKAHEYVKTRVAIPRDVITVDVASVLVVDDRGRRWRLPKTDVAYDELTRAGLLRLSREVATERDLFSVHGTFYELPAENADGFAKMRPIATHRLRVMDYCSYRGLLILTGVKPGASASEHVIRSGDGNAALWAGVIDDLWQLGKPIGTGGPWSATAVRAGQASDPYLFWGYDRRHLTLEADEAATVRVEVDLTGEGFWVKHKSFVVGPGESVSYAFPGAFQARWIRFIADRDCIATALLRYE